MKDYLVLRISVSSLKLSIGNAAFSKSAHCSSLQLIAAHCSSLQLVAAHCSSLQLVAARLQLVAARLQLFAV